MHKLSRTARTWRTPQQRRQGPHIPGQREKNSSPLPQMSDRLSEAPPSPAEEWPRAVDGETKEIEEAEEAEDSVNRTQLTVLAKQRLRYLQDAYTIGKTVEAMLKKDGKFDEALQLTRVASKDHKVVVSWNHLIDYQMRQQRLTGAIKLFNEVRAVKH